MATGNSKRTRNTARSRNSSATITVGNATSFGEFGREEDVERGLVHIRNHLTYSLGWIDGFDCFRFSYLTTWFG